ncbi:hypothetical protein [Achromobacter xylosoxidans]|nr:hypothetical protein [Achromobacter xylosoxidans]
MHPWPFDTITPERWATLPDEDKAMIEALTATFIAAVARLRQVGTRAPASDDRPYPARRWTFSYSASRMTARSSDACIEANICRTVSMGAVIAGAAWMSVAPTTGLRISATPFGSRPRRAESF